MKKKSGGKKRKFKGGVGRNAQKQNRGTQYAYLNLPKGINMFKEEPKSRLSLDILPYEVTTEFHPDRDNEYEIAVPGSLWYKRPYWLHRSIGSDNESVVCPSSVKKKCPICEYRAQLMKDGAKWDDDAVKALKPTMRNLYIVIPKGNKNYDEKIHVWDISQFLFQDKLNEEIGENEEYETFPDLEEGFTLRIRFSEESFGSNKFADTSRIDFLERKKGYKESILDSIPSLDDMLNIQSYKSLSAQFFGNLSAEEAEDEDDEDKDEDVPFYDSNEDEEEVEEEIEEDEDEEEIEEDEDENEDEEEIEEDEDEEEKPKNKKKDKTKTKKKKPAKTKTKKNKCPYGHEFGNVDEYDECDECEKWDDCMEAVDY